MDAKHLQLAKSSHMGFGVRVLPWSEEKSGAGLCVHAGTPLLPDPAALLRYFPEMSFQMMMLTEGDRGGRSSAATSVALNSGLFSIPSYEMNLLIVFCLNYCYLCYHVLRPASCLVSEAFHFCYTVPCMCTLTHVLLALHPECTVCHSTWKQWAAVIKQCCGVPFLLRRTFLLMENTAIIC